jgi:hypothetical protein
VPILINKAAGYQQHKPDWKSSFLAIARAVLLPCSSDMMKQIRIFLCNPYLQCFAFKNGVKK